MLNYAQNKAICIRELFEEIKAAMLFYVVIIKAIIILYPKDDLLTKIYRSFLVCLYLINELILVEIPLLEFSWSSIIIPYSSVFIQVL